MKILVLILTCAATGLAATSRTVEQWGVYQVSLRGPADGNPFLDITLSARFASGSEAANVPGF